MDAKERARLIRLLNNPPPGIKLAAAKEYGIDLTLLVRRLEMSPTERVEELQRAQVFIEDLRQSLRPNR